LNRILLVRLRQIGDVVFTTPAIRAVRHHFPHAHIAYIVEPAAAPIVAASPHLDEVIVAPRIGGIAGVRAEIALVRRLRAGRYDVAIDFHGGPRASILTWLSGAPVRIGYDVTGRSWMYTRRIERPRTLAGRHSVENQWDLLAPLGIPGPDKYRFPVEMLVDAAAARAIDARLAQMGIEAQDDVIVMHVAGDSPFRRWPAESFVATAVALATGGDRRRILITAGPADSRTADGLTADIRNLLGDARSERIKRFPTSSLDELRALFESVALYIGGDSGPLHVAATSHVPIVGLYGQTLPARSEPWRGSQWRSAAVEVDGLPCRPCDQRRCVPGDFRCLTRLGSSQVVDAAERLLASHD
jgi:ADP-heptose:LPS heptosyltransferase